MVPTNRYDATSMSVDQRQMATQFNLDNDLMCPDGVPNRTITMDQALIMEEHRPSSSTSSAAPHAYRNFALAPFSAQNSVVSPSQFGKFGDLLVHNHVNCVGSPSSFLTDDVDMEFSNPPTNVNNAFFTPSQQFQSPMGPPLSSPPPGK